MWAGCLKGPGMTAGEMLPSLLSLGPAAALAWVGGWHSVESKQTGLQSSPHESGSQALEPVPCPLPSL